MPSTLTSKVAVTHPGKLGDAIYSIPAIASISNQYGPVDFYTSSYCKPLEDLFLYQEYINTFNISEQYVIDNMGCGVQPWEVPVPDGYEKVFHLGFRETPRIALPDYMCKLYNLEKPQVTLSCPDIDIGLENYIVVNARLDKFCMDHYKHFVENIEIPCVVLGEYSGFGIDLSGKNLLECASIIKKSLGFFGISALFVIADFFNIPKVVLHKGFDVNLFTAGPLYITDYNFYTVKRGLNIMMSLSKTLNTQEDYKELNGYADHIENIIQHFKYVKCNDFRYEHEHRKWEYALAYKAFDMSKSKTVLDVGGGGSLLAPSLAWVGAEVTVVDPGEVGGWIEKQNEVTGKNIKFVQKWFENYKTTEVFDMVIASSVIEHIIDDTKFVQDLFAYVRPGGILFLSFDFHPSGEKKVDGHLRTYNKESVENMLRNLDGYTVFGGKQDYSHFDANVNGCTFASLVLRKKAK